MAEWLLGRLHGRWLLPCTALSAKPILIAYALQHFVNLHVDRLEDEAKIGP